MKFNVNNPKSVQMFNHCYQRACFHSKKRVRKKNYKRAINMLYNSFTHGKTTISTTRKVMKLLLGNDKMKWLRYEVE